MQVVRLSWQADHLVFLGDCLTKSFREVIYLHSKKQGFILWRSEKTALVLSQDNITEKWNNLEVVNGSQCIADTRQKAVLQSDQLLNLHPKPNCKVLLAPELRMLHTQHVAETRSPPPLYTGTSVHMLDRFEWACCFDLVEEKKK